ncbi:MAG: hypothetical protein KF778_11570 [Rhodocyclaceae bacterium]|nr:hypothetical protein [Rhodocyclaceae bacterium]MBX3669034.1 hypothetical protein [Rhodocyclaceae bacterium]
MRRIFLAVCLILVSSLGSALAQPLRSIPANAQRATMTSLYNGSVKLGSTVYALAPGALIFTPENRILLPISVPQTTKVAYQLDSQGMVRKVWILAPEEVQ